MKNNFSVKVSFKDVPDHPYEWDNIAFITGIKLLRVKTSVITDLLTYDAKLSLDNNIIMLSDCKTSIVLRLDKTGNIIKRSFLSYIDDENVCEYASNLKCTKLEYTAFETKLQYQNVLNEEVYMKEYIIKSLMGIEDENEYKYLYYLFFNEIDDYKKDRLIDSITKDESGNFQKLYDFLIAK